MEVNKWLILTPLFWISSMRHGENLSLKWIKIKLPQMFAFFFKKNDHFFT